MNKHTKLTKKLLVGALALGCAATAANAEQAKDLGKHAKQIHKFSAPSGHGKGLVAASFASPHEPESKTTRKAICKYLSRK